MSFPSTFGSQVAVVMDVLAKAAVAEITKLVEEGTVVLRLEMCRKDNEIQELQRSLKMMEVELCQAQGAAESRAAEEKQEQITVGTQFSSKDAKEEMQRCARYLRPQPEHSEDDDGARLTVKHEPAEKRTVRETTDDTATAAADVCSAERDETIWPSASCSMFEKSPVTMQQHVQMFPSYSEQFSTHGDAEYSYNSPPAAEEEGADDAFSVPIKIEVDIQPSCMGSSFSESFHDEPLSHVSHPVVSENRYLQSDPQQARLSPNVPHVQRPSADTHDRIHSMSNLRVKRFINVWRANPKLFTCSSCNKSFPRLSQLEEHKATHQTFKPFRCLECGKSFTQKTRLKSHQSVHTGERPFSCKICGKMFSRQDNCMRHERFHSGLKPYSCGQCGKSFTVLANLRMHQDIHLQGR
uniref:zinc finger and SCAN domain-containing protein 21-like n=1 Tax=Solea senegalensis TaxID=28829 RepID=UPI001CD8B3F6|nr:zinc finger and SCAN domain-containing protein 21-like [Solea senegalensis]